MNEDTKPMVLIGDGTGTPLMATLSLSDDEGGGRQTLHLTVPTADGVTGLKDGEVMCLDKERWPAGLPDELVLACWGACLS